MMRGELERNHAALGKTGDDRFALRRTIADQHLDRFGDAFGRRGDALCAQRVPVADAKRKPRKAVTPRVRRLQNGDARAGGEIAVELGEGLRPIARSEEHTSELQSLRHLVCRLLLEKKNRTGSVEGSA